MEEFVLLRRGFTRAVSSASGKKAVSSEQFKISKRSTINPSNTSLKNVVHVLVERLFKLFLSAAWWETSGSKVDDIIIYDIHFFFPSSNIVKVT